MPAEPAASAAGLALLERLELVALASAVNARLGGHHIEQARHRCEEPHAGRRGGAAARGRHKVERQARGVGGEPPAIIITNKQKTNK